MFLVFLKFVKDFFLENFKYFLLAFFILFCIFQGGRYIKDHLLENQQRADDGKSILIEDLAEKNNDLIENNEMILELWRLENAVVEGNVNYTEELITEYTSVEKELEKATTEIKQNHKEEAKPPPTVREKKLAEVRINKLWDFYCSDNKSDKECMNESQI